MNLQHRSLKEVFFLYIKILVSEQGNATCEKLSNCHNLLTMRNDKKDYRNSQHFAFIFSCCIIFLQSSYDHIQGSASYSFLQVHLEIIHRLTI